MKNQIDFVVIRSVKGMDAIDGIFALRELQKMWPANTRMLLGMDWREALALLPQESTSRGLIFESCWLSLDPRCVQRLHQAVDEGFDVALACDSIHPSPMNAPTYATLRGMERFVSLHPVELHAAGASESGLVELATVGGLQRRVHQVASLARVEGAWAHDAQHYFSARRDDVLPMIPKSVVHLLDVGGGEGGFLSNLKAERPTVHTTLAELTADSAAKARLNVGIDEVFEGRFEQFQSSHRFDCICFLDVLEHMEYPERALRHACGLLADSGVIVASIPNVGHWSVVADLLEGRWDWAPLGIHCYSHVRFFTEGTIRSMFERVGLRIEAWSRVVVPCRPEWLETWGLSEGLDLHKESLETYAYVLRARALCELDNP